MILGDRPAPQSGLSTVLNGATSLTDASGELYKKILVCRPL